MSDEWRDAGLAILGAWIVSGLLQHRAEHTIAKDVGRSLRNAQVKVRVEPQGLLGHYLARSSKVWIGAKGFELNEPPFYLIAGRGARAHTRKLSLDFESFRLRGIDVDWLKVDMVDVSTDLDRALFQDRIVVRAAGEGLAEGKISQESLTRLVERKFRQLSDVRLTLQNGSALLRAKMNLLGRIRQLETSGALISADGTTVIVSNPKMWMDGTLMDQDFTLQVVKQFNPVLDVEKDLGLGGFLRITEISLKPGYALVRGEARILPKTGPDRN